MSVKMLNVIKLMRYHLKRRQLLFQNKCINLLCISELTLYGNYRQRFPVNISHTNSVCDYSAVVSLGILFCYAELFSRCATNVYWYRILVFASMGNPRIFFCYNVRMWVKHVTDSLRALHWGIALAMKRVMADPEVE